MVSLINFKIVNEELTRSEQQCQSQNPGGNHMLIKVVAQQQHEPQVAYQLPPETDCQMLSKNLISKQQHHQIKISHNSSNNCTSSANQQSATTELSKYNPAATMIPLKHTKPSQASAVFNGSPQSAPAHPYPSQPTNVTETTASRTPNFVVTWRNLRFVIEPKWHQRMLQASPIVSLNKLSLHQQQQQGIGGGSINSQQQHQAAAVTKIVLDKLDGSFRSGELTAILGPSGK